MEKIILVPLLFIAFNLQTFAQDWQLTLSSNVYYRKWKLTTKAQKEEDVIAGASVVLSQNGKTIQQTTTDADGHFVVIVPKGGEYLLTVSYQGCNTKYMAVNTNNVPDDFNQKNWKPSFEITGGFIMCKPYPGISYSSLTTPLVRVSFNSNKKAFKDETEITEQGSAIVGKIYADEDVLFKKFCSTNKAGDEALAKPDCPLAKKLYNEAIAIIPGEEYPVTQLAKVGDCLKNQEEEAKKIADQKKAADEKIVADKAAKEKAAADKAEADKAAKQKADDEKAAKQKAADEKIAADKAAKEKAAADKAEADKVAKQKADDEKAAKQKAADEKIAADKAAKEKAAADKAEADKVAKQKAADEKAAKQKAADEQKAADKAAKEKAAADKMAKQKSEEQNKSNKGKMPDNSKEVTPITHQTDNESSQGDMDKGDSKYHIPQVLGANVYKEKIKRGDELFKMKRYLEAKGAYQEALKAKVKDIYATNKITECDNLIKR
ncbi:MAG: carboxypeptidase regulatory-like domain-containing protein [Bacteroidetes bacterium]|nr:carboxypeptidase regulatory-like domain-containing protein [Bacteroidota bacterium]